MAGAVMVAVAIVPTRVERVKLDELVVAAAVVEVVVVLKIVVADIVVVVIVEVNMEAVEV